VPAPFRGIGIRIEDDVLVTGSGVEVLSAAVPKQVDEIESLRAAAHA
jgi:Xaa-Pro aminopeptidase